MDTTINSIADQLVENMDEAADDNSIIEAKRLALVIEAVLTNRA